MISNTKEKKNRMLRGDSGEMGAYIVSRELFYIIELRTEIRRKKTHVDAG